MSPDAIRTGIFATLNTAFATSTTKIAWPNYPFDPADKTSYLEPTIHFGSTEDAELGETGMGLRYGILMINVYTKLDIGTKQGYDICKKIEDLYRIKVISGIMFSEPYTQEIGKKNGHWLFIVNVPFNAWIGES
jgi:hypothetical protein